MTNMDFVAAQSDTLEPLGFQGTIIDSLSKALLAHPSPPCLLRSPTGSGKTFMLVRSLSKVTAANDTVWLWFVPYVNLVQQTEDAVLANGGGNLFPVMLSRGRNQEPTSGMVLLSTAQAVAKATHRNAGYANDSDDERRALNEFIELARARKLKIGLVVDEAHIGLNSGTEFGKFAKWLKPEYLVMASATPKDAVLDEFLTQAGKGARTSFIVSRKEAVDARLNKRYIEAVIYDLQRTISSVTDLKRTVLRQAWRKHLQLKRALKSAGIDLTPLLLVQVANGDKTVEEARDDLIRLCRVHPSAIGIHSADAPDPTLMAAIANDESKEVLIFKQSAGTGFDAPRAFVLASTKLVNDPDFAMQFIGRVMRVARQIRQAFPKPKAIPADLDTAFVYLADSEAQQGFQSAVNSVMAVKSQLEGQTEVMVTRQTRSGATAITNRVTRQIQALNDVQQVDLEEVDVESELDDDTTHGPIGSTQTTLFPGTSLPPIDPGSTIMDADPVEVGQEQVARMPTCEQDIHDLLASHGLKAYKRNAALKAPNAFLRESAPVLAEMAKVSAQAATQLELDKGIVEFAVRAAYNLLKEKEIHTELTGGGSNEVHVAIVTDRAALAREARGVLRAVPQLEEEDFKIIIGTLAQRLRSQVAVPPAGAVAEEIDDKQLDRLARDAACWVIRRQAKQITEAIQDAVSDLSHVDEASPLPDAMLYPLAHALKVSRKNLYGVVPPLEGNLSEEKDSVGIDAASLMAMSQLDYDGGSLSVSTYDWTSSVNTEERDFSDSLDRDEHVLWWHRNPRNKAWSVRVVRGEHHNYFYPDFIVCLAYPSGNEPETRLLETKHDLMDAVRKAKHVPKMYGKVLFVAKDKDVLRVVNDDGTLGLQFDWIDLTPAWGWFAANPGKS